MNRKNYLLIVALVAIGLFFSVPLYNGWLFGFIMRPKVSYAIQLDHTEVAERRGIRYGRAYIAYMQWMAAFDQRNIQNAVILFPPDGFFKDTAAFNVGPVEPAMFYYFTGRKAAIVTSPYVRDANWAMVPSKKGTGLRHVNKQELEELITAYSKH